MVILRQLFLPTLRQSRSSGESSASASYSAGCRSLRQLFGNVSASPSGRWAAISTILLPRMQHSRWESATKETNWGSREDVVGEHVFAHCGSSVRSTDGTAKRLLKYMRKGFKNIVMSPKKVLVSPVSTLQNESDSTKFEEYAM